MTHIIRRRGGPRTLAEAERRLDAAKRRRARRRKRDRPVIRLGRRKRKKKRTLGGFLTGLFTGSILTQAARERGGRVSAEAVPIGGASLGLRALRGLGTGARKVFGGLGRGFFGTPRRAITTVTGIGILQASPKARRFVAEKFRDPTKLGRGIGGIIEDPSQLTPSAPESPFGRVSDFFKKAGLVGAGAALAAGIPVAIQRFRERRAATPQIFSQNLPTGILPAEPSLTPRTEPLGAAEKEPSAEKPTPLERSMPDIKITNKPKINISFKKSRRFINQQILMK